MIRYVDIDGLDAGLEQIEAGFAIARYDSRDGYGDHEREAHYVSADATSPDFACGDSELTGTAVTAARADRRATGSAGRRCLPPERRRCLPADRGRPELLGRSRSRHCDRP